MYNYLELATEAESAFHCIIYNIFIPKQTNMDSYIGIYLPLPNYIMCKTINTKYLHIIRRYNIMIIFLYFDILCKGSSMGTAVTYIMCGYLIASFGWESVFYVSGGLGLLWIICWILLVFDTPAMHPTISIREKTYIENCIGNTIQKTSKSVRKIIIKMIYR